MSGTLPLLPTMGVGSYAAPGWFLAAHKLARAGELGSHDVDELFDDATRVVIDDQIEAGLDIVSDGELGRQRFVYEMFGRIAGLERLAPARKLGISGYDMAPRFIVRERLHAPGGLGLVAEFRRARAMARGHPVKIALPGPLTFAGAIEPGTRGTETVLGELVTLIASELSALAQAGADYVQLDEPGLATSSHHMPLKTRAAAINAALAGVSARTAVHVCFGNNAGRPASPRSHAPLLDAIERLNCDQLVLEFANREMAEVELLGRLSQRYDIAAGVIDVKNFYVEQPGEVAERIERVLRHVPAPRLTVTADCGFSALPRYLARAKLRAMVEGARLVRARMGPRPI
jgi:5-methyltetrahydropteroyltriglutamate--homocysteine methyltransferase